MATKQVYISIDGLIAIARANGMSRYTYAIDGDTCAILLSEDGIAFAYSYTMNDVRADGSGALHGWREHFHQMFKSWSVGKAIRTHFKDAVEAAEKRLL